MLYLLMSLSVAFFGAASADADGYVEELRSRCNQTKRSYQCSKYKVFSFIDDYTLQPDEGPRTLSGFVRLVKMQQPLEGVDFFDESTRYIDGDSEVTKLLKFFQRKAEGFLGKQGIAFSLPDGAEVVDVDDKNFVGEARREAKSKKHKKEMLIPLIMLFKLFKIKVLVSLVLAATFFIKKTILVTALFLPSVIQSIKNHCKTSYHVIPHHIEDEHHEHDSSGAGWGYTGYGTMGHHLAALGAHSGAKDWDRTRIQRIAHGPVHVHF